MEIRYFLKPTAIKIVFTVVFLIPVFTFVLLTSPNFMSLSIGVIISYFLACSVDAIYQKCENKWIKAILIIAATLVSLGITFLIFLWYSRRIIVIYDPVHRPTECEIACEQIYKNVTNITEARQKYYECVRRCFEQISGR